MKNFNETVYTAKVTMLIIFTLIPALEMEAEESQSKQTIRNFFSTCLNLEIDKITEMPEADYSGVGLAYKRFFVDGKAFVLRVSLDGTTIYSYGKIDWTGSEAAMVEGKRHADAISETTAFASAVPLLNYFGFSTQKNDYEVTFEDYAYNTNPRVDDLWGAHWYIRKKLYLNGTPCHGRYVSVNISAASGAITSYSYAPIISPKNTLNAQVTYATAQQTAQTWLTTVPYLADATPIVRTNNTQGEIVIAPEWNLYEKTGLWEEEISTYYCWEVIFDFSENDQTYQGCVWVNIQTGDVVGAA